MCYTYRVSAAMVPPRPLHFSRSSISTCPACPGHAGERSRSQIPTLSERVHHTPSQSHFGTHLSMIPEKIPSLFSNTYGNPFCNSLCFQIHAGMGGVGGSSQPSNPQMRCLHPGWGYGTLQPVNAHYPPKSFIRNTYKDAPKC
jgi:hypothetical protein